jgi:hypothetical protein
MPSISGMVEFYNQTLKDQTMNKEKLLRQLDADIIIAERYLNHLKAVKKIIEERSEENA